MIDLPIQTKNILPPITLCFVMVILMLFNTYDWLVFERLAIDQGQWWRIFSNHFIHTNWPHLWLNVSGIGLIWLLFSEHFSPKSYFLQIISIAGFISLITYIFIPSTDLLAGLSGVLHGMFMWGALQDIKKQIKFGWALTLGIIVKVIWENTSGSTELLTELLNSRVATEAHFLGIIAGLIVFLFTTSISLKKPA